jgi:hypothetical protein
MLIVQGSICRCQRTRQDLYSYKHSVAVHRFENLLQDMPLHFRDAALSVSRPTAGRIDRRQYACVRWGGPESLDEYLPM